MPSPPDHPVPAPTTHDAPRRPDASMALVTEIVRGAGDGYTEASARRAGRRPNIASRLTVLVLMVFLGVLVSTTWLSTRDSAPSAERTQQGLRAEIERRTAATDQQSATRDDLRARISSEQEADLPAGEADRAALKVAAGVSAVTGPGLRVVLDDAPEPQRGGLPAMAADDQAPVDDGRVRDRELQAVVNALWAAGAEAIAVDDQRLTPQTAIRSAGEAILVDYRPLSPPYQVRAIGDPDQLQTSFTQSSIARSFRTYAAVLGIGFTVEPADTLALPAGSGLPLRMSRPAGAGQ